MEAAHSQHVRIRVGFDSSNLSLITDNLRILVTLGVVNKYCYSNLARESNIVTLTEKAGALCSLKRCYGPTYGRTDAQTDKDTSYRDKIVDNSDILNLHASGQLSALLCT